MGNIIIIEEITKKVMESAKLSVADETLEITENEADCESSQDGEYISGPQFTHSTVKQETVEMVVEESTKQSTGGKQPQMVEAVVAPVVDTTMKSVKQSTGGKQPQHVEAVVAPVTELLTKMSKSVSSKKKQKTKLEQQDGQQVGQETEALVSEEQKTKPEQQVKREVKQESEPKPKQEAERAFESGDEMYSSVSFKKEAILPSPAQGKSDGFVGSGSRPGSDKSIGVNTKNEMGKMLSKGRKVPVSDKKAPTLGLPPPLTKGCTMKH